MTRHTPNNAIEIMDLILENITINVNVGIDMTLGKGNDILKLYRKFPKAKLYGFDIQEESISYCKEIFDEEKYDNIELYREGHENFDLVLADKLKDGIDTAVFNFGYLPGYDKSIFTMEESSLVALRKTLPLLNKSAIIFLTFYPGHPEGLKEYNSISEYIGKLDQKLFACLEYKFINQINSPPILITIERL